MEEVKDVDVAMEEVKDEDVVGSGADAAVVVVVGFRMISLCHISNHFLLGIYCVRSPYILHCILRWALKGFGIACRQ